MQEQDDRSHRTQKREAQHKLSNIRAKYNNIKYIKSLILHVMTEEINDSFFTFTLKCTYEFLHNHS